jgi:hypothetical protein
MALLYTHKVFSVQKVVSFFQSFRLSALEHEGIGRDEAG